MPTCSIFEKGGSSPAKCTYLFHFFFLPQWVWNCFKYDHSVLLPILQLASFLAGQFTTSVSPVSPVDNMFCFSELVFLCSASKYLEEIFPVTEVTSAALWVRSTYPVNYLLGRVGMFLPLKGSTCNQRCKECFFLWNVWCLWRERRRDLVGHMPCAAVHCSVWMCLPAGWAAGEAGFSYCPYHWNVTFMVLVLLRAGAVWENPSCMYGENKPNPSDNRGRHQGRYNPQPALITSCGLGNAFSICYFYLVHLGQVLSACLSVTPYTSGFVLR